MWKIKVVLDTAFSLELKPKLMQIIQAGQTGTANQGVKVIVCFLSFGARTLSVCQF